MSDPRSIELPEGFFWSRRVVDDSGVGKWCVVYDSRYTQIIGNPKEAEWTPEVVAGAIEAMRPTIEKSERQVQMKLLLSDWIAGSA